MLTVTHQVQTTPFLKVGKGWGGGGGEGGRGGGGGGGVV